MFLLHLEQGSSGQIMHMHMLQASLRKCVTILAVMFHAKQGTVLKRLTTQPRISTALAKRLTSCQSSYMVVQPSWRKGSGAKQDRQRAHRLCVNT